MELRLAALFLAALFTAAGTLCNLRVSKFITTISWLESVIHVSLHQTFFRLLATVQWSWIYVCMVDVFFSAQLVFYWGRRGVSSLQNQTLLEKLNFPHPIHTLSRGPEGGTVEMECQDEMAETECQEPKERRETLVSRDLVAHKVCILIHQLHWINNSL